MKFEAVNGNLYINGDKIKDRKAGYDYVRLARQKGTITDNRVAVAFRMAISMFPFQTVLATEED